MHKFIAFDDDTAAKLTQLARDRMATFQELADGRSFCRSVEEARHPDRPQGRAAQERASGQWKRQGDPAVEANEKTLRHLVVGIIGFSRGGRIVWGVCSTFGGKVLG